MMEPISMLTTHVYIVILKDLKEKYKFQNVCSLHSRGDQLSFTESLFGQVNWNGVKVFANVTKISVCWNFSAIMQIPQILLVPFA